MITILPIIIFNNDSALASRVIILKAHMSVTIVGFAAQTGRTCGRRAGYPEWFSAGYVPNCSVLVLFRSK